MHEKIFSLLQPILIFNLLRNFSFEIEIFEERKFHQEKMEGVATPFLTNFMLF